PPVPRTDANAAVPPPDAKAAAQPTDAKAAEKPAGPTDAKAADVKATKNQDGSETRTFSDNSKIVVSGDKITEATGSDGHRRKFEYDASGKLEHIDGRLGHWNRTVDENGKTVWVNKDTGAHWKGEFTLDAQGNWHFKRHDGGTLVFGRNGETVRVPIDATAGGAGSLERTAASDAKLRTPEEQKSIDMATASPYFVTINTFVKGQPDAAKVIESLKGRSEAEIQCIKELYKKNNGTELEDDLKKIFHGREITQAFDILGTPKENRVNPEHIADEAKAIYD